MRTCQSCDAKGLKEDFLFCPYCAAKLPPLPAVCPNCGYDSIGGAKFCPECGTKLIGADDQQKVLKAEDEPIPTNGLTLEFGYSTSQQFDSAVESARRLSTFQQFGEGKKATYRVWAEAGDVAECLELVSLIRGWKSARVYVDGEKSTFDTTFGFLWCYERRQASFRPEFYCYGFDAEHDLNLWGCTMARMPFREYADWWQWGRWLNNKGDWQFDKERIRHNLQVQLFPIRYCPALQPSLVNEVVDALPDKVNPSKDKNWKFVQSWSGEDEPGGLVVKTKRYGFEETVVMKGVCPNGMGALKEIVKRVKTHRLPAEIFR